MRYFYVSFKEGNDNIIIMIIILCIIYGTFTRKNPQSFPWEFFYQAESVVRIMTLFS